MKEFNLDGIEAHLDKQFESLTFESESSSHHGIAIEKCVFASISVVNAIRFEGVTVFVESWRVFFCSHVLVVSRTPSSRQVVAPAPNPDYKPWLDLQKMPHELGVKDLHRTILPDGFPPEPVIVPVKGALSSEVRM